MSTETVTTAAGLVLAGGGALGLAICVSRAAAWAMFGVAALLLGAAAAGGWAVRGVASVARTGRRPFTIG